VPLGPPAPAPGGPPLRFHLRTLKPGLPCRFSGMCIRSRSTRRSPPPPARTDSSTPSSPAGSPSAGSALPPGHVRCPLALVVPPPHLPPQFREVGCPPPLRPGAPPLLSGMFVEGSCHCIPQRCSRPVHLLRRAAVVRTCCAASSPAVAPPRSCPLRLHQLPISPTFPCRIPASDVPPCGFLAGLPTTWYPAHTMTSYNMYLCHYLHTVMYHWCALRLLSAWCQ